VPIYEYFCQPCAYKFEVKQSIKDDPVANCTRCGSSVSRIISPPALMFKGTGWYITDYSDKLKPPASETTDGAASKEPAASGAATSSTSAQTTITSSAS
jgi:putative FmdB family regulatory protein